MILGLRAQLSLSGIDTSAGGGQFMITNSTNITTTQRFTIDLNGNVGIGTTGPGYLLEVRKDQNAQTRLTLSNQQAANTAVEATSYYSLADASADIGLFSSGYTGNTYLQDSLVVRGQSDVGGGVKIIASASSPAGTIRFATGGSTSGFERMIIDGTGNVGIGTTSPSVKLAVQKDVSAGDSLPFTLYNDAGSNGVTSETLSMQFNMGTGGSATGGPIIRAGKDADFSSAGNRSTFLSFLSYKADAYTEAMRINSSGNIGIGTTTPNAKLQVTPNAAGSLGSAGSMGLWIGNTTVPSGDLNDLYQIGLGSTYGTIPPVVIAAKTVTGGNSGSTFADLIFATRSVTTDTTPTERMRIDNTGNVGIGTVGQANALLDVNKTTATQAIFRGYESVVGAADASGQIQIGDTAANAGIIHYEGATNKRLYIDNSYDNNAGNIYFRTRTAGTPINALVVQGDGNVGIGTTSPSGGPLDVKTGATRVHIADGGGTSFTGINLYSNNHNWYIDHRGSTDGTNDNRLAFKADSTEVLNLSTGGNVGIGTTGSPSGRLEVHGANDAAILRLVDTANNDRLSVVYNSGAGRTDIYPNHGSIPLGLSGGAGTNQPHILLSTSGSITFNAGISTGTGGNYLCIDTSSYLVSRGNGSACTASSIRFKQDVQNLNYGLVDVMKMRSVSYQYKPETNIGSGTHLGFIAEEMNSIIPEAVTHDNTGQIFGIDYEELASVFAKSIQELNLNVETLANTTASSTAVSQSFAASFWGNLFSRVTTWFADAGNGIVKLFAGEVHTNKLCVKKSNGDDVCVTGDQLDTLLANAGSSGSGNNNSTSTPATDTTSPVITILGDNPAQVPVGSTYSDMGATVTDTNADGSTNNNLGLHFSVDGATMDTVVLDTSTTTNTTATTTHTIVYSAVDSANNWGYATRTVDVVTQ